MEGPSRGAVASLFGEMESAAVRRLSALPVGGVGTRAPAGQPAATFPCDRARPMGHSSARVRCSLTRTSAGGGRGAPKSQTCGKAPQPRRTRAYGGDGEARRTKKATELRSWVAGRCDATPEYGRVKSRGSASGGRGSRDPCPRFKLQPRGGSDVPSGGSGRRVCTLPVPLVRLRRRPPTSERSGSVRPRL